MLARKGFQRSPGNTRGNLITANVVRCLENKFVHTSWPSNFTLAVLTKRKDKNGKISYIPIMALQQGGGFTYAIRTITNYYTVIKTFIQLQLANDVLGELGLKSRF